MLLKETGSCDEGVQTGSTLFSKASHSGALSHTTRLCSEQAKGDGDVDHSECVVVKAQQRSAHLVVLQLKVVLNEFVNHTEDPLQRSSEAASDAVHSC